MESDPDLNKRYGGTTVTYVWRKRTEPQFLHVPMDMYSRKPPNKEHLRMAAQMNQWERDIAISLKCTVK